MSPSKLSCLAFAILVTICAAEALVPKSPTAFFSVRGGESRAQRRSSSLNVHLEDEAVGDDQAANGAPASPSPNSSTLQQQQQQQPVKQIRVTARGGLGATRMPPKLNGKNGANGVNGANGSANGVQRMPFPHDNIAANAIAELCEVEDRPIPAEFIAETALPTDVGQFRLRAYRTSPSANEYTGREPSVIYAADKSPFGVEGKLKQGVHVRIHDQCLTSEVFGSRR
jgi:hypothetical protein